MKVIERTMNKIIDEMYKNGGHWLEVTLKKSNKVIKVKRRNTQSFEDLHKELFYVYDPIKHVKDNCITDLLIDNLDLKQLAEYLIKVNV